MLLCLFQVRFLAAGRKQLRKRYLRLGVFRIECNRSREIAIGHVPRTLGHTVDPQLVLGFRVQRTRFGCILELYGRACIILPGKVAFTALQIISFTSRLGTTGQEDNDGQKAQAHQRPD